MTSKRTLVDRAHSAYVALQAAVNKLVKYERRGEAFAPRVEELRQEMLLRRREYCALLDEVKALDEEPS